MKKLIYIFLLTSLNANATVRMLYSSETPFALGRSHDLNLPFEKKEQCLKYDSLGWVRVQDGAQQMKFGSELVKDTKSMSEKLSFDVILAAKARFKVMNANARVGHKLFKEFSSFSDSVNYMVNAYYDFGERELLNPTLKPQYQTLLDEGKHHEFIRRCGTHFVESAKQGVAINLLLKVENLNHSEKKILESGLAASVSYGPFSGDLTAKLKKDYTLAKQFGKTSLVVQTIGGDPKVFNDFGSANDLEKTLKAMAKFMGGVRKEVSAPREYVLVSMERFGLKIPEYDLQRDRFLEKAYHITVDYERKLARLREEMKYIYQDDSRQHDYSLEQLRYAQQRLAKAKFFLDRTVKKCLQENFCSEEALDHDIFEIAWTSELLKKATVTMSCHGSDAFDTFMVVIEGELFHPNLVYHSSLTRISSTRGEENLRVGFQNFVFDSTGKRFKGAIEILRRRDHADLIDPDTELYYILTLKDHNHNEQTYKLDIEEDPSCYQL